MIAVAVVFGFVAVGLFVGLVATAVAPLGYQDETGFHYGRPEGEPAEDAPLGLPQPKTV